jgi:flagellar basal-body rod protein FlgC
MNEFSSALSISASGLRAQATRLRYVSENLSNTDTPGYRRKIVSFEPGGSGSSAQSHVQLGPVTLDRSDLKTIYNPAHPLADESGYFRSSNVNLMIEIADAREAQRTYEANLKMFDQTRQMSSALMDLLRK